MAIPATDESKKSIRRKDRILFFLSLLPLLFLLITVLLGYLFFMTSG